MYINGRGCVPTEFYFRKQAVSWICPMRPGLLILGVEDKYLNDVCLQYIPMLDISCPPDPLVILLHPAFCSEN